MGRANFSNKCELLSLPFNYSLTNYSKNYVGDYNAMKWVGYEEQKILKLTCHLPKLLLETFQQFLLHISAIIITLQ